MGQVTRSAMELCLASGRSEGAGTDCRQLSQHHSCHESRDEVSTPAAVTLTARRLLNAQVSRALRAPFYPQHLWFDCGSRIGPNPD